MAKQRYVNTGEHVLRKNKLKKKVSTLQERGKALEIKFAKQCYKIYTGGARVMTIKKYQLTVSHGCICCKEKMQSILYLCPIGECTYEKLGDAKELLEYLEKCIE